MKSEKYDKIFKQNKEWVESKQLEDETFFKTQYEEQNPDFLYIGCSDSRVPANIITGLEVGDLFVHRNIANVVSNNDLNIMSIIQYAVEQLKVKHIIVCGHYGCGGVKAAMEQKSFGLLDNWLRNVRDVYRHSYNDLSLIKDEEERYDKLVEFNVEEQAYNVIKTSCVQKSYLQNGFPTVHGWVYDMRSGKLNDLAIDFEGILKEIQKVYNIE
ncbi:MAG: carbonic anhydrase [Prolixibacteraceae bacterium]|jgi:carbonic anhydrase|nr:carbonic anhydrase [Prolixibacteraceae bacterium]